MTSYLSYDKLGSYIQGMLHIGCIWILSRILYFCYLLLKVIPNCWYLLRFEKTSKWNHFYYYVWAWRCTVLFIWIIIHQRGISCSGGTLVLTSAFVNKLEPTYVKRSYLNIWLDGFPNLICHMNVIDVWLFELNFLVVVILASLVLLWLIAIVLLCTLYNLIIFEVA